MAHRKPLPNTFQEAQRRARFAHRDFLSYRDRGGSYTIAERNAATIKQALLAIGTAGHFTLISADTGCPYRMNWRMGIGMIRNAAFGC